MQVSLVVMGIELVVLWVRPSTSSTVYPLLGQTDIQVNKRVELKYRKISQRRNWFDTHPHQFTNRLFHIGITRVKFVVVVRIETGSAAYRRVATCPAVSGTQVSVKVSTLSLWVVR